MHITAPILVALTVGSLATLAHREQADLFSAAAAYERFMGRWSRALAPLLLDFSGARDGEQILDVGSGTGALSDAILAAFPAARVVGIDPAGAYVSYAEEHHANRRARFEVGDAQRLRFAAASFDRTLSLLVVNFIPDRAAALREMIRVTRPGGTISAAVWDYGGGMEMLRVFWDEAAAVTSAGAASDERRMPLCRPGELDAFWREPEVDLDLVPVRVFVCVLDDVGDDLLDREAHRESDRATEAVALDKRVDALERAAEDHDVVRDAQAERRIGSIVHAPCWTMHPSGHVRVTTNGPATTLSTGRAHT